LHCALRNQPAIVAQTGRASRKLKPVSHQESEE
jgi:hypothetical protein